MECKYLNYLTNSCGFPTTWQTSHFTSGSSFVGVTLGIFFGDIKIEFLDRRLFLLIFAGVTTASLGSSTIATVTSSGDVNDVLFTRYKEKHCN